MDSIRRVLGSLGLTDKETAVYLVLHTLGTAPASTIAKRAQLPRSTVQLACQQLQGRGIISMVQRKNVYLYSADDSRRLLSLQEFQRKALERKQEDVHRIIGELGRLRHPDAAAPRVRFYEGEEGIAAAWQAALEDVPLGGEIVGYMRPTDPIADPASQTLSTFIKRRVPKRIRMRTIATDSPVSASLKGRDPSALHTARIMDGGSDGSPSEILICGDKIFLAATEGGAVFATIIESRSIAKLLQAGFESHWRATRDSP